MTPLSEDPTELPLSGIRVPTPRQAATLRFVAAGILPAPSAEVAPLVRWGWLETLDSTPAIRRPDGYFPPLRLSADGWRAVAAALDAWQDQAVHRQRHARAGDLVNQSGLVEPRARVQTPLHHPVTELQGLAVQSLDDQVGRPLRGSDRTPPIARVRQLHPPADQARLVLELAGPLKLPHLEEPTVHRSAA